MDVARMGQVQRRISEEVPKRKWIEWLPVGFFEWLHVVEWMNAGALAGGNLFEGP